MRALDDGIDATDALAGVEDHLGDDDEIDAVADRIGDVGGVEAAAGARLDERELDATAARVFAQDHVERVEFATRCDDARTRSTVPRIENRAQPLPGTRLRNDAVAARRMHETRKAHPIRLHLVHPRVPGTPHPRVPRGKCFAHIVLHRVERTAE